MIEVRKEGFSGLDEERCCFCRAPTRYWTDGGGNPSEAVACCLACADYADPEDVLTKRVWCRRERIALRIIGDWP